MRSMITINFCRSEYRSRAGRMFGANIMIHKYNIGYLNSLGSVVGSKGFQISTFRKVISFECINFVGSDK